MWGRFLIGGGALGLYGWRVHDPKGSYGAFFDASDWMTRALIADGGAAGYLKNFVNIVLVHQADGFLLGMAFMALISIVFWPVRKCGRLCVRGVRSLMGVQQEAEQQTKPQPTLADNTRDPLLPRHPAQPQIFP